ncbi:hypothetical protein BJY52DRAFT_566938 [Lactarius psammicola]|nr:hypothetical protein BJY52DRAFT_566938 [Lactarius psammicola]
MKSCGSASRIDRSWLKLAVPLALAVAASLVLQPPRQCTNSQRYEEKRGSRYRPPYYTLPLYDQSPPRVQMLLNSSSLESQRRDSLFRADSPIGQMCEFAGVGSPPRISASRITQIQKRSARRGLGIRTRGIRMLRTKSKLLFQRTHPSRMGVAGGCGEERSGATLELYSGSVSLQYRHSPLLEYRGLELPALRTASSPHTHFDCFSSFEVPSRGGRGRG